MIEEVDYEMIEEVSTMRYTKGMGWNGFKNKWNDIKSSNCNHLGKENKKQKRNLLKTTCIGEFWEKGCRICR